MSKQNKLLVTLNKPLNTGLRLFCFPYAGRGASVFADWSNYLPKGIELIAIQLPGRETRINELPFQSLSEMVDQIADEISGDAVLPYAFFGYSMGALVGFEVIRRLRQLKIQQPVRLFVCCFRAPQLKDRDPPIHLLPKPELIREIKRLGGTPDEVFDYPELVELLIPIIRRDIQICETYEYKIQEPLDCPISAYGGLQDKKLNETEIKNWAAQTSSSFETKMFRGDHFFLKEEKRALLETISNKLKRFLKSTV